MFERDDAFGRASLSALRAEGLPAEMLAPDAAALRFPQIAFDAIASILWEPEAGYVFARRACAHVVERLVAEGGLYRQGAIQAPIETDGSPLARLVVDRGPTLEADVFVFACGPWLGSVFPDVVGSRITPTRQEVYYFGTPAGDARFLDPAMPVWLENGPRFMYGVPGNAHRGFKVADDTPGPEFDPTAGSRQATPAGIAVARAFLGRRFPALARAPLLGSEVCQYEATPDSHFLIDRHPGAANAWIVGGGSGHGFKMGPAVGEDVASYVLGAAEPDPQFGLVRLAATPPGGWAAKWSSC
jgi:glycine/D-amino acid oxidase-like deaminating enzyme